MVDWEGGQALAIVAGGAAHLSVRATSTVALASRTAAMVRRVRHSEDRMWRRRGNSEGWVERVGASQDWVLPLLECSVYVRGESEVRSLGSPTSTLVSSPLPTALLLPFRFSACSFLPLPLSPLSCPLSPRVAALQSSLPVLATITYVLHSLHPIRYHCLTRPAMLSSSLLLCRRIEGGCAPSHSLLFTNL